MAPARDDTHLTRCRNINYANDLAGSGMKHGVKRCVG